MASLRFEPPGNLDFEKPNWKEWRKRFNRWALATKLKSEEKDVQLSSLIFAMGPDAEDIYAKFVFAEGEDKEDLDTVLKKFDEYFIPAVNIIHERTLFYDRFQQPGENIETFVRNLYALADTCDFDDKLHEQIRDRLVVGMLDKHLSEKLQLKGSKLTLTEAIQMARTSEQVKDQLKTQKDTAQKDVAVNQEKQDDKDLSADVSEVRRPQNFRGRSRGRRPQGTRVHDNTHAFQRDSDFCGKCGYSHALYQCPARNARCRQCRRIGHYAAYCQSMTRQRGRGRARGRGVREVLLPEMNHLSLDEDYDDYGYSSYSGGFTDYNEYDDSFYLDSVVDYKMDTKPWNVKLSVQGVNVTFKIDSGADVSVITESTYNKLPNRPVLEPVNRKMRSVGGVLTCLGRFETQVKAHGQLYRLMLYVIRHANCNLLSRLHSQGMGFLQVCLNETEIGHMKCPPVTIKLKDDVKPYSLSTARRVSLPLLPKVKAELNRMQDHGVIIPVEEPTEWCAPMVPVIKKNGSIRICVDLKRLNEAVIRERYQLPTLDDLLPKLRGAKVFSCLDAASGFWAIPLDDKSAKLTTFISPFGRFCFKRLPFGITSAPEIFQRIMSTLLGDMDGVALYMDDILVFGNSPSEHDERLAKVLRVIEQSGLKLNKQKCVFRQPSIDFLGHVVDNQGVRPSSGKIQAITSLTAPTNVTELRRCLGMFTFLGRYVPDMATVLKPMTSLLKSDAVWHWDHRQQQAFDHAKQLITRAPVLAYYDPTKPTVVSADASSYGLGATLLQGEKDNLRPVAFASRTMTEAEKRYAQIEKECLAAVWACEKFGQYLTGLDKFTLYTDHKPLVPLIMTKDLDRVPARCQRLLIRMMRFNPQAVYVPGKALVIADMLSRSPENHHPQDESRADEVALYLHSIEERHTSQAKLAELREATALDNELQQVIDMTISGWPVYAKDVPSDLVKFHELRGHLSVSDGLLLFDDRIYVPQSMQKCVLSKLHDGHQGITKCRERARTSVYWIGLSSDIKNTVESCEHCQKFQKANRKEPLMPIPIPERPWSRIAADLCDFDGIMYLVVIDYYSRYLELVRLHSVTTRAVVTRFQEMFARWGLPDCIVSDNGPQFVSAEFQAFCKPLGIGHITSSPHFPQSNGMAERAVQIAKSILRQPDPLTGLMVYRATPTSATGYSPAQLIMGRNIKTSLPMLPKHLDPCWPNTKVVRQNDALAKTEYKTRFDARHGARDLPPFSVGDKVRVRIGTDKNWKTCGTVTDKTEMPRSVIIQTDNGQQYRRNQRHLRRMVCVPLTAAPAVRSVPLTAAPAVRSVPLTAAPAVRSVPLTAAPAVRSVPPTAAPAVRSVPPTAAPAVRPVPLTAAPTVNAVPLAAVPAIGRPPDLGATAPRQPHISSTRSGRKITPPAKLNL